MCMYLHSYDFNYMAFCVPVYKMSIRVVML